MKRTIVTVAALGAVLVPAAAGLWGNASFSQAVPVRVPASAEVAPAASSHPTTAPTTRRTAEPGDDSGGRTPRDQRTEAGDDRDAGRPTTARTRSTHPAATRTTEAGDDSGGRTPRDQRTEAGDDRDARRGSSTSSGPGTPSTSPRRSDDRLSGDQVGHGSDDRSSDDHGGHGSDDRPSDDHGGHGGDD